AEQGVTHMVITPSALATLDPEAVPSVRVLAVAGEAIGADLVRRWARGRTMLNLYGPTESTIWATAAPLVAGTPVTIGGPIRGTGVLVRDARLWPVPTGVPGELYLSGPALARGYHGRPELNATRFVADPYGAPGERMYRTGDLVRWTRTGELEYLGRTDFQVKVRGQRVELGEIDTVLTAAPGVEFALTLGVPGPGGGTALAAYLVAEPGAAIDVAAVREHAAASLPAHRRAGIPRPHRLPGEGARPARGTRRDRHRPHRRAGRRIRPHPRRSRTGRRHRAGRLSGGRARRGDRCGRRPRARRGEPARAH